MDKLNLKDIEHDTHIDDLTLSEFIDHTLLPVERQKVISHIAHCKRCRDIVMMTQQDIYNQKKSQNIIPYILAIASSLILVVFIPKYDFGDSDTIIYKGSSDMEGLKLPKLDNTIKSSCSEAEQKEANRYLDIAQGIEDENSSEYFETLVDSMEACYSPEVATKVYIIKAQNASSDDKQIKLLHEALTHSASIRNMKFKLEKELFIFNMLKPHFRGIELKDINQRIQIKTKVLNEISK